MEVLSQWVSEIFSFLIGSMVGYGINIGITRFKAKKVGGGSSQTGNGLQQTSNVVGGDIAGGDVNK